MNYVLDKKNAHERLCEEAIRTGRNDVALFHAAKAAEFAVALARKTPAPLAERYLAESDDWLKIAERIKARAAATVSSGARAAQPAAEAEKGGRSDDDWLIIDKPNVTFAMIAGMADAKRAIRESVILPLKAPETARRLKLRAGGGVLLYGPPGTGKTTLAKAVATELEAAFFYATGAQIRSKWHGESEQRLRDFIQQAKQRTTAVMFLDDADGLLHKRGGNSVVDDRIVAQFLNEIGGFEEQSNVLLWLASTNRPWQIDEAVLSRFADKIYVGLPDIEARMALLHLNLDGTPLHPAFKFEEWAHATEGFSGRDIVNIVTSAKRAAMTRSFDTNTTEIILDEDVTRGMKSVALSATPEELKRFEAFRAARFK